MANTLFIKPSDVAEICPISPNIDTLWMNDMIHIAQQTRIKAVVQELLYNELITNILANTLTPDQITLLTYIRTPLAYLTLYETLPFLNYQITAKGTRSNTDIHSDAVDLKTSSYIRTEVLNKGEFYLSILDTFLKDNATLYAPFYVLTANCQVNATNKIYNSPTYFY